MKTSPDPTLSPLGVIAVAAWLQSKLSHLIADSAGCKSISKPIDKIVGVRGAIITR